MQAVHQSSAVLGLGLIGMAEDLGSAMAHRALEHLLQYGDSAVRLVALTVSTAGKPLQCQMVSALAHFMLDSFVTCLLVLLPVELDPL